MASTTQPTVGGFSAHPEYLERVDDWRIVKDAYLNGGGFRDGSYVVGHSREYIDHQSPNPRIPSAKLTLRRRLARWENVCAQIVNAKTSALFKKPPVRRIGNPAYAPLVERFWQDVDGQGTHIDDFLPQAWVPAALFGHAAVVFDWQSGATAAEAFPYLCVYDALCVSDWAYDERRRLTEVRLLEEPARLSVKQPIPNRLVSRTLNATHIVIEDGRTTTKKVDHPLGKVPLVMLQGRRIPGSPLVGAGVVGDGKTFIDFFNLTSEKREILRFATFPILNVPVGNVAVDTVKGWLGETIGIQHVLFTPERAYLIEPDGKSVEAYQVECQQLLRTIFRLADISWESDSRDAESAEALRLKADKMNTVLSTYGDELQRAEYAILELLFRFRYGAEHWKREYQAAQISVAYPDDFDVTSIEDLLERVTAALALDMGQTFTAETKKRLTPVLLPDAAPDLVQRINTELDALPADDGGVRGRLLRLAAGDVDDRGVA